MPVQPWRKTRLARATLAAVFIAPSVGYLGAARATVEPPRSSMQGPEPSQRPFAADVTIRQRHVVPDGTVVPTPVSAVSLHVERAPSRAGWTTTLTLTGIEGADAPSMSGGVLDNPFLVTRVEYDDGGAAPRMFNRRGERVREPGRADRDLFGSSASQDPLAGWAPGGRPSHAVASLAGDAWSADLTAPAVVEARRRALEATFGPAVERKQDFNRHVLTQGDQTTDALVDAVLALPIEVSTTKAGALVSRTTMTHERDERGALGRRRIRVERPAFGMNGGLSVVDVDLVRVAPGLGGGR